MIIAIDPGEKKSAIIKITKNAGKILNGYLPPQIATNDKILSILEDAGYDNFIVIEDFEPRGHPLGKDSITTIKWIGRFIQKPTCPTYVLPRRRVKALLGVGKKGTDAKVRAAMIAHFGKPGTKAKPGPTYGITSHLWQALGLAVAFSRILGRETLVQENR